MPVIKCYACHVTSNDPVEMLSHDEGGHFNPSDNVAARLMMASSKTCVTCGSPGAFYTVIDVDDPKSVTQVQLDTADNNGLSARCRECIQNMIPRREPVGPQAQQNN